MRGENCMSKRLYKSRNNVMIDGVCGGIAEYFNLDPTIVRLVVFFAMFFTAVMPGVLLYIVAALIMPRDPR